MPFRFAKALLTAWFCAFLVYVLASVALHFASGSSCGLFSFAPLIPGAVAACYDFFLIDLLIDAFLLLLPAGLLGWLVWRMTGKAVSAWSWGLVFGVVYSIQGLQESFHNQYAYLSQYDGFNAAFLEVVAGSLPQFLASILMFAVAAYLFFRMKPAEKC